jgi:hypothetical protein
MNLSRLYDELTEKSVNAYGLDDINALLVHIYYAILVHNVMYF